MGYSVRSNPVGGTSSQTHLTAMAALDLAERLAVEGHKNIVITNETGAVVDAQTLALAIDGNR